MLEISQKSAQLSELMKIAKYYGEWAWAWSVGSIAPPNAPHLPERGALIVTKFGALKMLHFNVFYDIVLNRKSAILDFV